MKILLAIKDKEQGLAMAEWLTNRPWPKPTQIKILTVIPWHPPDRELVYSPTLARYMQEQYQTSHEIVTSIATTINNIRPELAIEEEVQEGSPAEKIISTAHTWEADIIVMGAHDKKILGLFMFGSVPSTVAKHAQCSIMVLHANPVKNNQEPAPAIHI